jgi:hypothetical protein
LFSQVGDPQEVNAIADVFCKDRNTALLVGSVKSNMGHSEPASGLCSVAKVLIAMESSVIPPNLHYKDPNPDIPALSDGRLQVSCVEYNKMESVFKCVCLVILHTEFSGNRNCQDSVSVIPEQTIGHS